MANNAPGYMTQRPDNNTLASGLKYAQTGASLGSVAGPWGTAIGAAAGAIGGSIYGAIDYNNSLAQWKKDSGKMMSQQKQMTEAANPYNFYDNGPQIAKHGGKVKSGRIKGSGDHENPVNVGAGGHMIPRNMERVALPLLRGAGVNTERNLPVNNGNTPILAEENERYVAPQDVAKFEAKTGIPIERLSPNAESKYSFADGGPVYDKTWDVAPYQFDENFLPKNLTEINQNFENIKSDTESYLNKTYPGKNYSVGITGEKRDLSTAKNNAALGIGAAASTHQIGAARDYQIYENGKFVPGNTPNGLNLYKNSVWEMATKHGYNHLRTKDEGSNGGIDGSSDPYHIGVVQERGDGTAFKRAFETYPDLKNSEAAINTKKEIASLGNSPTYKSLYDALYGNSDATRNVLANNHSGSQAQTDTLPSPNDHNNQIYDEVARYESNLNADPLVPKPNIETADMWNIAKSQEDPTMREIADNRTYKAKSIDYPSQVEPNLRTWPSSSSGDNNSFLNSSKWPEDAPASDVPDVVASTATNNKDQMFQDFNKSNNLQLGVQAVNAGGKLIYNMMQKYQPLPQVRRVEPMQHITDFGALDAASQTAIDRSTNTGLYNARENNSKVAPVGINANQMQQGADSNMKIEMMRQEERNLNADKRVEAHNVNAGMETQRDMQDSQANNVFRMAKGQAISQTSDALANSFTEWSANKLKSKSILEGMEYGGKYTDFSKWIQDHAGDPDYLEKLKKYKQDNNIT